MSDNNPKALTFGGEEHNAPLADISHLTEREKLNYRSKGMKAFGTYDYEQFKTDEEFELALACGAPYNCRYPENCDKEMLASFVDYQRSLYYHKKKYRVWEKEILAPMVKRMADYALDAPQYDASYLLGLELHKMECMDAYLSHSVTADSDGNYPGGRWLRLCIKLLHYLIDEHKIPDAKILAVNPRNITYPMRKRDIDRFITPEDSDDKLYYGRKIYWHKAHRLYNNIRTHALHTWWD